MFPDLSLSALQGNIENTLALANLKFDFSLIKCEATPEYKGVGECISTKRKQGAEDGSLHRTARQLGALFLSELPSVPRLIKAYGHRATEIAKMPCNNPHASTGYGPFAQDVGADTGTIWAAITSGEGTVVLHLLACMLARVWKQPEAISIWSELVEQRQIILREKIKTESIFDVGDAWASRIEVSREQLAAWDNSARAWLRTADQSKIRQQTQLRLIVDNISLPVSQDTIVYKSTIDVACKALKALDDLVEGKSLRIQDGPVLLGLSSWHLYPDMIVVGEKIQRIDMTDPLIPEGALITIGIENRSATTDDGIYWSLPLAHLRFYGDPTPRTSSLGSQGSHIKFDELLCVALGCVIGKLQLLSSDMSISDISWLMKEISRRLDHMMIEESLLTGPVMSSGAPALKPLLSAMEMYERADALEIKRLSQLVAYGRKKGISRKENVRDRKSDSWMGMITHLSGDYMLFGLNNLSYYWSRSRRPNNAICVKHGSWLVKLLRDWAAMVDLWSFAKDRSDFIIILRDHGQLQQYTDVFPRASAYRKWSDQINDRDKDRRVHVRGETAVPCGPGEPSRLYCFLFGDSHIAAIFCRSHLFPKLSQRFISNQNGRIGTKDLLILLKEKAITIEQAHFAMEEFCLRSDYRKFEQLNMLAAAQKIYSQLPGALVNISVIDQTKRPRWWEPNLHRVLDVWSCIIYFESGHIDVHPGDLKRAIAVSNQNSLYVAGHLLNDPSDRSRGSIHAIRRFVGNVGKPGICILISPTEARINKLSGQSWQVVHTPFEGELEDNFSKTSCHISLTDYELPVDTGDRGLRDTYCVYLETVISVFDGGRWIADLDASMLLETPDRDRSSDKCVKLMCQEAIPDFASLGLVCADSWDALLDAPSQEIILRAHGNAEARLAATCVALQKNFKVKILGPQPCWNCVKNYLDKLRSDRLRLLTESDSDNSTSDDGVALRGESQGGYTKTDSERGSDRDGIIAMTRKRKRKVSITEDTVVQETLILIC